MRRRRHAFPVVLPLALALAACDPKDDTADPVPPGATDQDGDGWTASEDCDDLDPTIHPEAEEVCDALDNDCDDLVDGDDDMDVPTWHPDEDDDGYGDVLLSQNGCEAPHGYVTDGTDCNDNRADVHPGATETWYDGTDQDCAGGSDWDADADGFDSAAYRGEDCDDLDPAIHPGAAETWYDGIDQDCDGANDLDADADGFDSADHGGDDCDDAEPSAHPGARETWYDGVDQDCDGGSDLDADADGFDSEGYGGDDCDDAQASVHPGASDTWYDGVDADCAGDSDFDADADGHDATRSGGDDCDDTRASTHPGATDAWYDGVDADCAGDSDWDADGDGYEVSGHGGPDCDDKDAALTPADTDGDGYSTCTGDCDDRDADLHPGALEEGNGLDDDCNGIVDDLPSTTILTTTADFRAGGGDGNLDFAASTGDGEAWLASVTSSLASGVETTSLSSSRSSMGVVATGGWVYVIGGTTGSSSSYTAEVVSSAISSGALSRSWTTLEPLPAGTTAAAVATDGHCLVVAGGGTSSDTYGEEVYSAVLNGDGTIEPWVDQAPLPTGLYGASGLASMGFFYVLGGQTSSSAYTSSVLSGRLDPDCTLDAWTATTDLPDDRAWMGATTGGPRLYLFGGMSSTAYGVNDVWMATPDADGTIPSWTALTDLPDERLAPAGVVAAGYLVVTGGFDGSRTQDQVWGAALKSTGTIGSWSTSSRTLFDDLVYHRIVAWDGWLVQVGGRTDDLDWTSRTADVWSYAGVASGTSVANEGAWQATVDLGAVEDLVWLDWTSDAASDGVVEIWYRTATGSGDAGAWTSAGTSGPALLTGKARYVQVWADLSTSSGTRTGLEDVTVAWR